MMTPRDQISQDLSYFSGPSTSGAARQVQQLAAFDMKACFPLTDIVGSVAGGLEGVSCVGFLGKPKVC